MSCNSIIGIGNTCGGNQGSATAIYVAPFEDVTGSLTSGGTMSAITMSPGVVFVEIVFNKNSANFNETMATDEPTGGQGYTQTINVTIPRREVAKRQAIAFMAEGDRNLALITKDGNGLYNFWGYSSGVNLRTVDSSSGENKKVGTSYKLVFLGDEPEAAPFVDPTIIPGLL